MGLNSSGIIALGSGSLGQSVNLELGKAIDAQISMNDTDVRTLAQKTGFQQTISFEDFWGKPISPTPTPTMSITPSITPSKTPSMSVSPTPSLTPPVTVTPTPSVSPPPAPTYPRYSITFCTGGSGLIVSTTTLTVDSTTVYRISGGGSANCFVVDSLVAFVTSTPTSYMEVSGCSDAGCIQL